MAICTSSRICLCCSSPAVLAGSKAVSISAIRAARRWGTSFSPCWTRRMFPPWTGWATATEGSNFQPFERGTTMSIRAIMLVGLLGLPIFAGAALAAETGNLSLTDAARLGDREAVRSLLNGRAKEDVAAAEGAAALIWAASRNDVETADLLLGAGVDVQAANEYGATALYVAAANADSAMTVKLLAAGADANAHLLSGETLLMEAARRSNIDTVRWLLSSRTDPDAREVNCGQKSSSAGKWERHCACLEWT